MSESASRQSASLMTTDKTSGNSPPVQARIRLVYPAGSSLLPRILRGKQRSGHAYQAHLGTTGVTLGNPHAYSYSYFRVIPRLCPIG